MWDDEEFSPEERRARLPKYQKPATPAGAPAPGQLQVGRREAGNTPGKALSMLPVAGERRTSCYGGNKLVFCSTDAACLENFAYLPCSPFCLQGAPASAPPEAPQQLVPQQGPPPMQQPGAQQGVAPMGMPPPGTAPPQVPWASTAGQPPMQHGMPPAGAPTGQPPAMQHGMPPTGVPPGVPPPMQQQHGMPRPMGPPPGGYAPPQAAAPPGFVPATGPPPAMGYGPPVGTGQQPLAPAGLPPPMGMRPPPGPY